MLILLLKLIVYGHIGFLLEIWFTGIHSFIFKRDKTMTATTYLPMVLVYGFTALALEGVSQAIPWTFYLKAFLYVPIIYGMEALSGWTLKQLIGSIPWDYHRGFSTKTRWTPMGLINLKYAPFWLLVAMAFDPITDFLTKMLHALTLVA